METIEAIKSRLLGLPIMAKVMGIALGLAALLCLAQVLEIGYAYSPLEEEEVEADIVLSCSGPGCGGHSPLAWRNVPRAAGVAG